MDYKSGYFERIGRIVVNLQSLELALRLFLCEANDAVDSTLHFDQLSEGDLAPLNPLTDYPGLGSVIGRVNAYLQHRGIEEQIDASLVRVRDALAHGRIMSQSEDGPMRLWKFEAPESQQVKVSLTVELTPEWLAIQSNTAYREIQKIARIARELGFLSFPLDEPGP